MSDKLDWLASDESQWTTGAHARDKNGNSVDPNSLEAVSWDLFGALRTVYVDTEDFFDAITRIKKTYKFLYKHKWEVCTQNYFKSKGKLVFYTPLHQLNDLLSYAEVKRLLFYFE